MLKLSYSLGRIFIALLFIVSGVQKVLNVGGVARMLADAGLVIPLAIEPYLQGLARYDAAGYAIGLLEITCGLMVMLGFLARWAALVLIVFTAGTIVLVHHFWTMDGAPFAMHQSQALKNLSIIGGLLLVVAGGSHGHSFNGRR